MVDESIGHIFILYKDLDDCDDGLYYTSYWYLSYAISAGDITYFKTMEESYTREFRELDTINRI